MAVIPHSPIYMGLSKTTILFVRAPFNRKTFITGSIYWLAPIVALFRFLKKKKSLSSWEVLHGVSGFWIAILAERGSKYCA